MAAGGHSEKNKTCVSRNCNTNARIKLIIDTAIDDLDLEWKNSLSILEQIGNPKWPLFPTFRQFSPFIPTFSPLFPTFHHFSPFFPTFHYFFQLLATFPTVSHFSQLFPNFPHFLPLFSTFSHFSHIKPLNHIKPLRIFLRYLLMQHLIKFCIKHIDSNSYLIYAMACL